ncbi:MAG: hypothetical protein JXQ27_12950 [Acidobacteria bacterium]|nr:hypothetical protein [Acidobacteriota bacterium]
MGNMLANQPRLLRSLILLVVLLAGGVGRAETPSEYTAVKERLARGWNSWDSRDVLAQVYLPAGLAVNLAFKQHAYLEEKYLERVLIGRRQEGAPQVRPGLHAADGSYQELELRWEHVHVRVRIAHAGADLVVLVTPLAPPPAEAPAALVVQAGLLWNRPGTLCRDGDILVAELPGEEIRLYCTAPHRPDPYVPARTPYLVTDLRAPVGVSSGRHRDVAEIERLVTAAETRFRARAARFGPLAEAFLAVESGVAWNTIYEPKHDRVVSTVGRLWNEEYGGYCLFGWDNFFLAYATALWSRDLAYANVLEHLRGRTEEGFIPNDNRGNGSQSWDRSQPPVGGLMVREIYRRYPERWFLAAVFDDLLAWNRWWLRRRLNDGLLSYGSHPAPNPFGEPVVVTATAAGYESGMDDSPMYDGVPFNPEKHNFELQDVGLTSLVIADCRALAEMAALLGRDDEQKELLARADTLAGALERCWSPETGLYLNRRTDAGELSPRLSPTLFYPLLAGVPDAERSRRMVREHLLNEDEFWGTYVIPSVPRDDPDFPRQRYWKGAIWPPLNFLTYLGLRRAGFTGAAGELAARSLDLFLKEWRRMGYVSENYSSITGTGDDPRLSSDRFHSWGVLMGLMAFIEAGHLPPPEGKLAVSTGE